MLRRKDLCAIIRASAGRGESGRRQCTAPRLRV